MHKKAFLFFLCVGFFLPALADPLRIAAVVNNEIISNLDLDSRIALILLGTDEKPDKSSLGILRKKVIRQLVEEALQRQETKLLGIDVSEAEILSQISTIEEQNGWEKGFLKKNMAARHIPQSALYNQLEAGIGWAKLISHLRSYHKPGETEVKRVINLDKKREQNRYLLAEIFIPLRSGHDAHGAALEICKALKEGHPFDQVAFQTTASPAAARGGDIGWVDEDQLEPEVTATIKDMPAGALSEPIQIEGGYKIILVRGKHDMHTSHDKLSMRQLTLDFPMMATEQEKETIAEKTHEHLKTLSSCKAFENAADTINGASLQIHENVLVEQLSGGLAEIANALPENQVSEALPIEDKSVTFFMVCHREKASDDAITQEKEDEVRDVIAAKKVESVAVRRMQDMYRRAFVDVRI